MSYDPSPPYQHEPYEPHDVPRRHGSPPLYDASPPYATYPWQPVAPPEPAPGRRTAHRPALGHHSDLRILRSAYRWQRRTATLTALGYFTLFLILSAFAPGLMTSEVSDGLPTGLLLALIQLPVTWLAIGLYEHTARRHVDPIADRIRRESALNAKREEAARR
ncbi:DUF485 domain-containing protein [Streptomyces resistomycificus]|uniref:DUF485 domain-containing protein n=1 Tax=Streptomyces resistomycificus TaxID=67356 RepID=A0A0L8KRV1_9ACTN|nr:DUF485 domain-containing protein [Streptomyces resistomycificus]KOG28663.1 hypothetical protein ADK37_38845 [Streptomyces resistomycificus]KUN95960.1 hypothetical protein AQJ84_20805 [Streptomyces resistomycificus]